MDKSRIAFACTAALGIAAGAQAAELEVTMHELTEEGTGKEVGTIRFRDDAELGVLVVPELKGLPEGVHGFHVHEKPDCGPETKDGKVTPGGAAGGHYDPEKTGKHAGPAGKGHLGDLPALIVSPDGDTPVAVFAPRLKTTDLVGRAVMIHSGGDNYADEPKPLGGGGSRIACGVVEVGAADPRGQSPAR